MDSVWNNFQYKKRRIDKKEIEKANFFPQKNLSENNDPKIKSYNLNIGSPWLKMFRLQFSWGASGQDKRLENDKLFGKTKTC